MDVGGWVGGQADSIWSWSQQGHGQSRVRCLKGLGLLAAKLYSIVIQDWQKYILNVNKLNTNG